MASDVRQHIVDVALPLVLRKGFAALGLAEILGAAGVPKGSFYHYFGSKERFGEAVIASYFESYLARMSEILAGPGLARDRLLAYFDDWYASQTGDEGASRCLVVKLGAEVSDLSESLRAGLDRGTHGIVERLARCLEAGAVDGSLPPLKDARATARELYQSWLGAGLLAKITRSHAPLDAVRARTRAFAG